MSETREMISLIIPTYNEAENIVFLLDRVSSICSTKPYEAEIIVVDDNSPDKTWEKVEIVKDQKKGAIRLLRRFNKRGLSSAVLEGFSIAKGTILGVMDADLSHPPEMIPEFVDPIIKADADFTIGSRYIKGAKIDNWPFRRKITSKLARLLARPFTDVKDPLSGFFFIRREIIDETRLYPIGFKIGLEIIVKGNYKNLIEIPITFADRRFGESKLTSRQRIDYLIQLFQLIFSVRGNWGYKRRGKRSKSANLTRL